jgi:hypothetical protein
MSGKGCYGFDLIDFNSPSCSSDRHLFFVAIAVATAAMCYDRGMAIACPAICREHKLW